MRRCCSGINCAVGDDDDPGWPDEREYHHAFHRPLPICASVVCNPAPLVRQSFAFAARSGVRYQLDVRVGEGSGTSTPCTGNGADDLGRFGVCDSEISSGQHSCSDDFCAECGLYAHNCDLACGFFCPEDGVTGTILSVLPPGATDATQAIAIQNTDVCDKGIAFTASATGTFRAVVSASGSGPVTLTVTAAGTTLERSPILDADGLSQTIGVSCETSKCTFEYSGAKMYDSDGSGFDLLLPNAEAGRAYAVEVQLVSQTAAQITATFFQAGAAAGAASFEPVVSGPMGDWSMTPAPSPCTSNEYDEALRRGEVSGAVCDDLISAGLSCAADFCSSCGQYASYCDLSCGFLCAHHSFADYFGDKVQGWRTASFGVHPVS